MSVMFCNASQFNQPLNNWDVSNVTDMRWMFYGTAMESTPPKWFDEAIDGSSDNDDDWDDDLDSDDDDD